MGTVGRGAARDPVGTAMKRRIEITRERWTRVRAQATNGPLCSGCGSVRELMPLADAARAAAVSADRLGLAVKTGLLAACDAPGGSLVCLGCIHALLISNKL